MAVQVCKQGGVAALRTRGEEQKKEVNAKDPEQNTVEFSRVRALNPTALHRRRF